MHPDQKRVEELEEEHDAEQARKAAEEAAKQDSD